MSAAQYNAAGVSIVQATRFQDSTAYDVIRDGTVLGSFCNSAWGWIVRRTDDAQPAPVLFGFSDSAAEWIVAEWGGDT